MIRKVPKALEENMVALGILLVVFVILYFLKPAHPFQPMGIALPSVETLPPPTQQAVVIYDSMPFNAKVLASVNVEGHTTNPTSKQQYQMLQYARNLAAQAGANGLVVDTFGYEGPAPGNPAALAKMVLFGKAIKT